MKQVSVIKKEHKSEKLKTAKSEDQETTSSAFLQLLLDSIPIPIFYQDNRGVYLGGNQKFRDLVGRKTKDIVGKRIQEIVNPDIAEIFERADQELLRIGEAQTYEGSLRHADGTERFIVFSKAALNSRTGKRSGLIGAIFDITSRKELEDQLRKDEEKFRLIFESIQDVYYEIELDGTIVELSPSIEKYFPFKRENLIGRSIYDFYVDKDRRKVLLQSIQEKGNVHDFEIQLKDGLGYFWTCSITATIQQRDGKRPPWIVGSMRDISERKQNEETLRQREEELFIKSRNLEEMNTALKVLLKQRDKDRKEIEENVLTNVKSSILPYIEKLKENTLTQYQQASLEMLEWHIRELISPFIRSISESFFDLTPQEIRVADLVKSGNTTKEIAGILGISMKTVDYHRDNLRKKLGIKSHQTNLRSFLLRFS